VEIKNGVENAEQVVVGGQERLAEGAPVSAQLVDRRPAGGREDSGVAATQGGSGTESNAPESSGAVKPESQASSTQDSEGGASR